MVSGRRNHQLRWRLVLAGEGLSHASAVRWSEMENAERSDALADELQPRADDWRQSPRFVLSQHVSFRFMHPPLLVPWSEIKVRRKKGWVLDYVIFTMGHELAIPLRIRAKLAAKLMESAGRYWPVEET